MKTILQQVEEAASFLRERIGEIPRVAAVLGSGLNRLLDQMDKECEISFTQIPHMRAATVEGHHGKLVVGRLGPARIVCLQGRLHYYEGYAMQEVVLPFRALAQAGVETFLLTNAAGGLQPGMNVLDLMLIRDHLNFTGTNPLLGPNIDALGPRFPDMTYVYDREWSELLLATAKDLGIELKEGVYVGLHGPSYETPAEIKMYRRMGGDAVGMSTVPEAIALRHMGKRVVGISFISNLAAGVLDQPLVHSEVIESARLGYPKFSQLVTAFLAEVAKRAEKP